MNQHPDVLVLTPQESQIDDLEVQLENLSQEIQSLPERIRQQAPPPAPRPAREEQLRTWTD